MPIDCPSSVHTKETSVPSTPISSFGECLRHSCLDRYYAAEAIYSHLDSHNESDHRFKLEYCRSSAWFVRNITTGEVRVAANACHLRWCPVCSDSRRNYISHSVAEWVEQQAHPKFLTLTLKHSDAPLSHQVDCLYKSFRLLRKRLDFKNTMFGGIWFFQIKKSKTDHKWHPHLHLLCSGLYLPHSRLSRMWRDITLTSDIVDIRPIRDPAKASADAARYAACPGSLVGLPFDDALELVECMHGRRICGTWGTAKTVSLRPQKQDDKDQWVSVGTWDLVMKNKSRDEYAKAIAYAWSNNQPLQAGIDVSHLDPKSTRFELKDLYKFDLDEMYPDEECPP